MTEFENQSAKRTTRGSFPELRTLLLEELLLGQREVLVAHGREVYRLRLTRNGKLILTK